MAKDNFGNTISNLQVTFHNRHPLLSGVMITIAGTIIASIILFFLGIGPGNRLISNLPPRLIVEQETKANSTEVSIKNEGILSANRVYSVTSPGAALKISGISEGSKYVSIYDTNKDNIKNVEVQYLPMNNAIEFKIAGTGPVIIEPVELKSLMKISGLEPSIKLEITK